MSKIKFCHLIFLSVVLNLFSSCNNDDPVVEEEFVFPSKVINKIVVDANGAKWFATEKGVISFDGLKWTSYADDQNKTTGSISDIVFDRLSGIKKLWLGSNVGLSSYEFGTSTISTDNFNTSKDVILSDTVSALGIDKSAVKYIATSKGLSILKGDKWDEFYGRNGEEILTEFKISSIAVAENGYIYAATEGGGISRFKYTDAISGATTFNLPWAGGLPSENVLCVITEGNAQWYGTDAGIAYHASELAKSDWTTYTRADGLICDTVYAIAKDLAGNVWFGTHKGISKLAVNSWQNFTVKDGIIADKINSIAIDADGSLWFGTDKGISHFSGGKWENF